MIDALFLLAVLCGCVAALKGNRTARVLLAGTALTSLLTALQVPYHPAPWMLVDIAMIWLILKPGYNDCDCLVVALFTALWPLYFVDGLEASNASALVAALQFLLTWPMPAIAGGCGRIFNRDGRPPWERMVAHA